MTPEETLKRVERFAATLKEANRKAVFVGLPSEKVGSKIYGNGMTVLRIGAIHEFGASFMHPGGTRFTFGPGGKPRFVSNSFVGPVAGVTKPHQITIPQRSFLRVPFRIKAKEMNAMTVKQFAALFDGRPVDTALGRIGATAVNISKGAFTTLGYGDWQAITPETARRKGSSQTMIDSGILRGSITWVIRDAA